MARKQNLKKQCKVLQVQNSVQSQINALWFSRIFFLQFKRESDECSELHVQKKSVLEFQYFSSLKDRETTVSVGRWK